MFHLPKFRQAIAGLLISVACCAPAAATDPVVLLDQIRALPGVVAATQASSPYGGTLFFRITFEQPVDHADPALASERDRLDANNSASAFTSHA
jgi:hypothetical protein